jgi:hypothetical protein
MSRDQAITPVYPRWCRKLRGYLEQNSPTSREAYARAKARHPALQPYATVLEAADAAAALRDEFERDAIVRATVAEFQAEPAALWSAAVVVAMAPALTSLIRRIRTSETKKDAPYCLLDAFYESVRTISLGPRLAFRLYSETRRRAFRFLRIRPGDAATASEVVVDGVSYELEPELCLDAKDFLERARTMPPHPGERPSEYLERVSPSRTHRRALRTRAALALLSRRNPHRSRPSAQRLHAPHDPGDEPTDEDRLFESVAHELPGHVEPVRLYEAYLRNFEIESGRGSV